MKEGYEGTVPELQIGRREMAGKILEDEPVENKNGLKKIDPSYKKGDL